ncbi:hypothetical protein ABT294_26765 [Nonomuraea sp. NPDC000554]|uniref:hypothetical protein n=1 Tax=Nonomuraea sp. NPDC000554 TaxID=3154259 RepID=UPI00331F2B2E
MTDRLMIQRQVAAEGARRWETAATILEERLRDAAARIESLNAATPWGHDAAGREFEQAYMAGGGPSTLLTTGGRLAGEAVSAARVLNDSVAQVVEADAQVAASTRTRIGQVDPR